MTLKIASWNVNSVKARFEHVRSWLRATAPDILFMQEIKCETESFPIQEFSEIGYTAVLRGQKSYNGVATLARLPQVLVQDRLPGDQGDEQARYVETQHQGLTLINIYAPNGNPVESDKYPYKLAWLERLTQQVKHLCAAEAPFLIGGDFNIIPTPMDVHDAAAWADDALYRPATRDAWRRLINLGLTDAFRALHPARKEYSFWDYQAGCWPRNAGIRIDHFLLSPRVADRLLACDIDRTPRGWDKASDHTPITLDLAWP